MAGAIDFIFRLVDKVTGNANNAGNSLDRLDRLLARVDRRAQQAGQRLGSLGAASARGADVGHAAWSRFGQGLDAQGARIGRLQGRLLALTAAAATLTGLGFAGKGLLDGMSNREGSLQSLSTLLRGQTPAQVKTSAAWINNFADVTPFEDKDTMAAVRQLLAARFSFGEVKGLARVTGDAASALGSDPADAAMKWQVINRALGQIKSKGRLQGDELLQLQEAGIGTDSYLKAAFGQNYLKKVSAGQVDATSAINAIVKGMDAEFGGAMARMSTTFGGLFSTLVSRPQRVTARMFDIGGLDAPKKLLSNLVDLTDFSKPPGSVILSRLSGLGKRVMDGLFGPLADMTGGQRGAQTVDYLLNKLDEFEVWWAKNGPVIVENAKGIWQGLKDAWAVAAPLVGLIGRLAGIGGAGSAGDNPEDNLPPAVKGLLSKGLLGRAIGFVGGLKLGLEGLDAVTFGASGKIVELAGGSALGLLGKELDAVKTKAITSNFWLEVMTNPKGKLVGLRVATAAIWAEVLAIKALGAAALSNARLEILTNPAGKWAGVKTVVNGAWAGAGAYFARLAAGGGLLGTLLTRLGPIAARVLGLVTGPIGLIVLAVTAIKLGGDALYNAWKPFADLVDGIYDKLAFILKKPEDASGTLEKALNFDPVRYLTGQKQVYDGGAARTGAADPKSSFQTGVSALSKRLGIRENDLLAVMNFESSLNAAAKNPKSGATGLIQFMPGTAKELGTSTGALQRMTRDEQLPYVEKYLRSHGVKPGANLEQLYMSVLSGSAGTTGALWKKGTAEYTQNAGLDINRDGTITSQEAVQMVIDKAKKDGISLTNNITINGNPTPEQVQQLTGLIYSTTQDALAQHAAQGGYSP